MSDEEDIFKPSGMGDVKLPEPPPKDAIDNSDLFAGLTDEIALDDDDTLPSGTTSLAGNTGKLELKTSSSPSPPPCPKDDVDLSREKPSPTPPLISSAFGENDSIGDPDEDNNNDELFPKVRATGTPVFAGRNNVDENDNEPMAEQQPLVDPMYTTAMPASTISAVSPLQQPLSGSPPTIQPHIESPTVTSVTSSIGAVGGKDTIAKPSKQSRSDDEVQDEPPTNHKIDIVIKETEKRGEGLGSYMAYRIVTKVTGVPSYTKREYEVWRRFSDFLGLHDKLATKHLHNGRIVPPAPGKDVIGTARTKIANDTSEDENTQEFLSRRQASLERFLRRVSLHPLLLQDPDFREFITLDSDLPKASHTSALSGTSVIKLFGKLGDTVSKMTFKMDENDQWFEDKMVEIDNYDEQFRKLHSSMEQLVQFRKELSSSADIYCKSMYMLAACEENTALSRAFSQLAETEEKVGMVHAEQADKDFYIMSELLKDYIGLITTIKVVFHEREKAWQASQNAQSSLTKKRENKTRLELAGKSDKLVQARKEVKDAEMRVQETEDHFEAMSKMIRKEMRRFNSQRVKDFKNTIVQYLDSLALTQQQIIKYWESFLPEAKSITV